MKKKGPYAHRYRPVCLEEQNNVQDGTLEITKETNSVQMLKVNKNFVFPHFCGFFLSLLF
jgi:hypothetical protein